MVYVLVSGHIAIVMSKLNIYIFLNLIMHQELGNLQGVLEICTTFIGSAFLI